MPQAFWLEEYRRKALMADAVAQSGRGDHFQAVEFLHVVREVVELLDLRRDHDLLDVGCANGLMDIVLAACCRTLLALDPVAAQVELARRNLAACPNVRVDLGHAAAIPSPDQSFDRVLVFGVIQLMRSEEVTVLFRELRRVLRPGGRALVGSIPDVGRKDGFLGPYLEGVRAAAHLSEERKAEILARNEAAQWYDAEDLAGRWRRLGGEAEVRPLSVGDPDWAHRFHLSLSG